MNYWDNLMADDAGAATYMESYGEGPGSALRFELGKLLQPEQRVLDVGCGPGWNFDHFLEYGPSVYYRGMDYSERFVRVANARTQMNIFKLGDVRHIPEPDLSFDAVILQDVLEHTNGYEGPLQEALRVARGRVIVTFWRMSQGQDDTINDDGDDGYGAAYSRSRWEAHLSSLPVAWTHKSIPRKDTKHDIYIIDKETDGETTPAADHRRGLINQTAEGRP